MYDRVYTTPEGFTLHKPLLLPQVTRLDQVLTVERRWDYATMNHRNGVAGSERPDDIEYGGLTFSRFCPIRHMRGEPRWVVTPTEQAMDACLSAFGFDYTVGWEVIYHASADRCLVVASQVELISSRYVAYVLPSSVPVATDTEVVDAIATTLGTTSEWNADQLETIANLVGWARPHPGDSAPVYREEFLRATGRPVVKDYVGDEGGE